MGDGTTLSPYEVQDLLRRLSDEWQDEDYDLLRCNCCHFSAELCRQLGGGEMLKWVLNLAGAGAVLEDGFTSARSQVRETVAEAKASTRTTRHTREMTARLSKFASTLAGTMRRVRGSCSNQERCRSASRGRGSAGFRGGSW